MARSLSTRDRRPHKAEPATARIVSMATPAAAAARSLNRATSGSAAISSSSSAASTVAMSADAVSPAPSAPCSPPRRYGDIKARPTQAMPANSLFGSVLERLRPDERRQLLEMDLPRLAEVARRYEAPRIRGQPPPEVDAAARAALDAGAGAEVAAWRQEVTQRRAGLARVEQRLKGLHERSRFDLDHPLDLLPAGEEVRRRHAAWLGEANRVGLGPTGDFDRDRHARRPPVHSYGLIGDLFRPGMDFDVRAKMRTERRTTAAPNAEMRTTVKTQARLEKLRTMPPKDHVIPGSELIIPANIKHQFGTQLCEDILSDPNKVEVSKRKAAVDPAGQKKPSSPVKDSKPASPTKANRSSPGYEMLGGTLRSNMFPGITKDHHESSSHRVHAQDVYERRDDVPDQFRFRWDHVSRWNEANVLHERMMKGEAEAKPEQ